ncbi:phosphoesterase family-domain-containing protein [Cercophora newfieldiana]|uniref:Phosphoesterase family-domain-containing protein n=1 Tax=Cercophora newfieldiana TaxID=92897 RepID=A0AA39XVG4_9PEZI|nr:phosphoesterase family-domain-containing protein [Cercophora newfieldiana]
MKSSIIIPLLASAVSIHGLARLPSPETTRSPFSTIQPSLNSIFAEQGTVTPSSPTSNVEGKAFDRIVQIWLENIDFDHAAKNHNMQWLAERGITLTNYFAVTHPSQPNYAAAVAGDYFGMDEDTFVAFPRNISTVADLLDTRGISWGVYQEHIPHAGFRGMNFSNRRTGRNDYVRKHNPLILFDSVAEDAERRRQIKGGAGDGFAEDLKGKKLPQWVFVTPNMTNNAHDSSMRVAGRWVRGWLEGLLGDEYFMEKTLVVVTFDECGGDKNANRVFTVLLGGAIPRSLWGTKDDTFYSHYSTISTVSANWDLPSLGRWDCHANILPPLSFHAANRYQNAKDINVDEMLYNKSYAGPASEKMFTGDWWPAPNTVARCASGMGVLESIKETWGVGEGSYEYTRAYPDDGARGHGNVYGKGHAYGWKENVEGEEDEVAPPPAQVSGAPLNRSRSHVLRCLGYVAVVAVLFL